MSVDDAVTGTTVPPAEVDPNAQAAEDAKRMLAELKAGAKSAPKSDAKDDGDVKAAEAEAANGNANGTNLEHHANDQNGEDEGKGEQEEGKSRRYQEKSHRGGDRPFRGWRGRGGYKGSHTYKENIKSDLTTLEESSDPVAIRKQVEFYFSDSNLPMDKFLLGKVGGSENNSVELKIIHSFKRMRHFQPFEAIVAALKESTFLNLTDDDTCVQRKEPLPEILNNGPDESAVRIFEDRAMPRSIYVKGFGEELPTTQFDIEAFFAPYGPTNAIRLRRSDTKMFKGSVFVEFASEDLQKAFLDLDPKPKYKGTELAIMSKKAYCDGKVEDIKAGKIKGNENRYPRGGRDGKSGRDGRDHKRKRDDGDDRDWKERREDDRKSGFRDRDSRRGGHRGFGSKGGRGDRRDRRDRDSNLPADKDPNEDNRPAAMKTKRDAATLEALAKAKAMVDAESKNPEVPKPAEADVETKPALAEPKETTEGEAQSKKRGRDDDGDEADTGPSMKKVDSKPDTMEPLNGQGS